jgi:pheromone shutdown protein TraB
MLGSNPNDVVIFLGHRCSPGVATPPPGVLLRDRDLILAESIRRTCAAPGERGTVVAVLGAAHCNGVKRHLMAEVPAGS